MNAVESSEYSADISATDSEIEDDAAHDWDQRMFALMGRPSGNVKATEKEAKLNVTQPTVDTKDDIANKELDNGNVPKQIEVKEEANRNDHVKDENVEQAKHQPEQPQQPEEDGMSTMIDGFKQFSV